MRTSDMKRLRMAIGVVLASFSLNASAQKGDDVQVGNVWAAAPVKVDGKVTEWENTTKSSNKSTHLTYTMANDDKNLYLVIESPDNATNNKIMLGGISLIVNTDNKKKTKDAFSVTYPVINRGQRGQGGQGGQGGRPQGGGRGGFGGGNTMTQAQRDSAQAVQRKTQLAAVKEIKVLGFKNIQDSIISIYNEYGVKAAAVIDDKNTFFYELSIPLNELGLSADSPKEFMYNVRVNGLQINNGGGFGGGDGNRGGGGGFGGGGNGGGGGNFGGGGGNFGGGGNRGGGNNDFQAMMSPTDFWGKYTLAKKQ